MVLMFSVKGVIHNHKLDNKIYVNFNTSCYICYANFMFKLTSFMIQC